MKRIRRYRAIGLAVIALTVSLVSAAPMLRAQDITIKDPGEFNAYVKASSQGSPRAKAAQLESFLQRYPDSAVKAPVLDMLLDTYYRGLNDPENALSAASRLLEADPNNMKAILISVVSLKNKCTETGDAQACDDAAALARRGLEAPKPTGVSANDWNQTIATTYPIYRSAIALGRPEAPASEPAPMASPPASTQRQYEEVPPPPPPPADTPPPTISIGQTVDQVITGFGPPLKIARLGIKEIFYYKDMKVTFMEGKVSDVE
jgi:hypothetical protein